MEVQALGSHAFVVYIKSNEAEAGTDALREFGEADIRRLLSPLLPDGVPVRVESYPGRNELLIFVQKCAGRPLFFRFDDFESLLAASQSVRGDTPSSLHVIDGVYVLALRPWDSEDNGEALAEFGEMLDVLPEYAEHLEEHGKTVISRSALAVLRQFFDK